MLVITYQTLHGLELVYLSHFNLPAHCTYHWSSLNPLPLDLRLVGVKDRAFFIGSSIWNFLPYKVQLANMLLDFTWTMKILVFFWNQEEEMAENKGMPCMSRSAFLLRQSIYSNII